MNLRIFNGAILAITLALQPGAYPTSDTMTYQGVLLDDSAGPIADGSYAFRFDLFDDAAAGTLRWTENRFNVPVTNGVFTTVLGTTNPFNALFADFPVLFMQVGVNLGSGLQTYGPRVELSSVPYAFDAASLGGMTAFELIDEVRNSFVGAGVNSTISGGSINQATGASSTVGGGQANSASGFFSTVAGGNTNQATTLSATVGGGAGNVASGSYSTVPGGLNNEAIGSYSFAAGRRAHASTGAFCWADSTNADFSAGVNQFYARATNGFFMVTGVNPTVGAFLGPNSGTWVNLSDRNLKKGIEHVEPADVLDKVAAMPVTTWSYLGEENGVRHMGPTAQDFHAAFGLGATDKGITTIDAQGVALAAIQGLHAENRALEARIAELEALVSKLLNPQEDIDAQSN